MSKVSIIMPTFNRGWIISRAIDSILAQSFQDFELVIVDDNSTDDTSNVVKRYSDKRIKYIKSDVNVGAAGARNVGLKQSNSEIIAYLDSDNLWYEKYLEVMVNSLENKGDNVMVYSGQNLLLAGGDKNNTKILGMRTRNEKYDPYKMTKGNYIDINCVIHKRNVLDNLGYFDESLKTLEDWDLFVRIVIKYPFKVKHVDQILGEYYFYLPEVDNSQTNQQWLSWIKRFFEIDTPEGDDLKVKNKINELLTDLPK